MNKLSNEVQAAIIYAANDASLEFAGSNVSKKKGAKSFTRLYAAAFEKNYRKLVSIITEEASSTASST